MITNFKIFEESSTSGKKLFYHATKSKYLLDIIKNGLTPNTDRKTNWKGELEEFSRHKLFVTENFNTAKNIINY